MTTYFTPIFSKDDHDMIVTAAPNGPAKYLGTELRDAKIAAQDVWALEVAPLGLVFNGEMAQVEDGFIDGAKLDGVVGDLTVAIVAGASLDVHAKRIAAEAAAAEASGKTPPVTPTSDGAKQSNAGTTQPSAPAATATGPVATPEPSQTSSDTPSTPAAPSATASA